MKKIVTAGLLALAVLAASAPRASAWIDLQFGIGFNFGISVGGFESCFRPWACNPPVYNNFYGPRTYYNYGPVYQSFAPAPLGYAPAVTAEPTYGGPWQSYGDTYQFANYPRPVYYYPNNWYGR